MFTDCASLIRDGGFDCPACRRRHTVSLRRLTLGRGALEALPAELSVLGVRRPYLLADENTWRAAGERAAAILAASGVSPAVCLLPGARPAPNEASAGCAVMHLPPDADGVIGVGGGVIGDMAKLVAAVRGAPYLYVPTAPSMDGMASATSSVDRDGLKISLPTRAPSSVVADTDVLAAAPRELILAGYGDMAAKYVSLAEWELSHEITGEFYCPEIARAVREALLRAEASVEAALAGDAAAAGVLTEGLLLAGLAMECAGLSRPASGMEHYVSHIRSMRALSFGTRSDLHGLECGAAALGVIRVYERLREVRQPDRARALAHAASFDYAAHAAFLRTFAGAGAETMIALEAREGKYDAARHGARLEAILARWERVREILWALPPSEALAARYARIAFPTLEALGVGAEEAAGLYLAAPDIRDKYVQGRLLWDLGEVRLAEAFGA